MNQVPLPVQGTREERVMQLLTALAFTAVLGLALMVLLENLVAYGRKIVAALEGRSLLAEPALGTRPVKVRMSARRVSRPLTARARLRAVA